MKINVNACMYDVLGTRHCDGKEKWKIKKKENDDLMKHEHEKKKINKMKTHTMFLNKLS